MSFHAKPIGEHGSPAQFLLMEYFVWIVIIAVAKRIKIEKDQEKQKFNLARHL